MVYLNEEEFLEQSPRLNIIINKKCNFDLLSNFHRMGKTKQNYFNKELNKYIKSIENIKQIEEDFNDIVGGEILNEDFEAEKCFVRNTNPIPELLLTNEQKEHLENEKEKNGWDEIRI